MSNSEQKQLYQEAGKYRKLQIVDRQAYWQKKQEEYDAMALEEKEMWSKATDENLAEIQQYLLTMQERINNLPLATTI